LHAEPCIAAAQAGKHVICEKPLGRDAAEARRMLAAVRAAGVVSMVTLIYRDQRQHPRTTTGRGRVALSRPLNRSNSIVPSVDVADLGQWHEAAKRRAHLVSHKQRGRADVDE